MSYLSQFVSWYKVNANLNFQEGEGDPGSIVPPPSRLSVLRGGLNFVPGGIQQAGKKNDSKEKGDGSDDNESESELSSRPMFGAGGAADSR